MTYSHPRRRTEHAEGEDEQCGAFDSPSDYARVHRRVKRLWNEGIFELHQHAQVAMAKRKMDVLDLQQIILHGSIISHDLRDGQWRYRIQGSTVANVTASC